MKATINRKKLTITVTGIHNESMLDDVTYMAEQTGCIYEQLDYSTKVVVKCQTPERLDAFVKEWSK